MPTLLAPPSQSGEDASDGKFSFMTALAFSINFAMGAGFLTLPFAFFESGVVLATFCNLVITIPLSVSLVLVLEAMARGSAVISGITNHSRLSVHDDEFDDTLDDSAALIQKSGAIALVSTNTTSAHSTLTHNVYDTIPDVHTTSNPPNTQSTSSELLVVGEEKIELADLCEIFLGPKGKYSFIVIVSFYNYGCLWLYTAVFSHALTLHFPILESAYHSYVLYTGLFALLVVPLSCLDLTEQVFVQMTLSLCRVLVILIMVSTSLIAYVDHGGLPLDHAEPAPQVDLSGFALILSTCAYAFLFSQGLPVLAEPARDKRGLGKVFQFTLLFMVVGYSTIGVSVALLFGSNIRSSCNLLWGAYTMGNVTNPVLILLAKVVSSYVVLFPALDCLSAYPLMAIMLGNSLHVCFTESMKLNAPHNKDAIEEKNSRKLLVCYRLLAAVPPIIGATFVSHLGVITNYTGISGIVIGFIFPPLLSAASEKMLLACGANPVTVYSSAIATAVRPFVLYLGIVLCIFVLAMNIFHPPAGVHESN
mmetsp:Transcript_7731/g.13037  ORF Transcript_7731/g.13037 Transcript_7731/m.13037 type:complete len:534 (+) Transcript_7731:30-1631(+)